MCYSDAGCDMYTYVITPKLHTKHQTPHLQRLKGLLKGFGLRHVPLSLWVGACTAGRYVFIGWSNGGGAGACRT